MKNRNLRIRLLLLAIGLMLVAGSYHPTIAQDVRWMRVGQTQTFFVDYGSECELTSFANNYLAWPTQYGDNQYTTRMKCLWIGCKNFNDQVEKKVKSVKVVGAGPRFDPANQPGMVFSQHIRLIGRSIPPIVTVDQQTGTNNTLYDVLDDQRDDLPCDRMIVITFNTSMGVSVTKKVMAFTQQNHDNYFIHDYVFKNTGIYTVDSLPDGVYHIPIEAVGYGVTHTLDLRLNLTAPYFTLTPSASALAIKPGASAKITVTTAGFYGSSDPIWLDIDNPPAGLSWAWSDEVVLPGESATLTLTNTGALNGQHTLQITGDNGVKSVIVTLKVVDKWRTYLPLMARKYVNAPDLVVTSLQASTGKAQVVIKNQGTQASVNGFDVDVYINPIPAPTAVNQVWDDGRAAQGLVWNVTSPLQPGQVMTLTIGDAYYLSNESAFAGTLPIGTPIYAQVDSYNPSTNYGEVLETHEILGLPYNNILGPKLSTAAAELPAGVVTTDRGEYFLPLRSRAH